MSEALGSCLPRTNYARALCTDDDATLDDLHEAVTTVEDAASTARRVLGGAHPTTTGIEKNLRNARALLRARETPGSGQNMGRYTTMTY